MIYFILLLALVLRLPGITQSLWLDEAAQAMMSSTPFTAIWQISGDFHPPLFHSLLHFWMKVGMSEAWMRILPLVFGVVTVYLTYLFGLRILKSKKVGLMAALLLAVAPYHVWYSQELRSYSLVTMLTLLSAYLMWQKKWKIYAVINLLAFFANYMYAFVMAAEFIYLLIYERKAVKLFLFSQMPLMVAFAFWWPQFKNQLDGGYWLTFTHPEWRNLSSPNFLIAIPLTFAKFILGRVAFDKNPGFLILIFLVLFATIYIFWKIFKKKKKEGNFLLMQLMIPIILAWAVSFFIPLNGPWRLILVLPFMYLLIAEYIEMLADRHLIYIFLLVGLFGIFLQNYAPKNQKEDWRGAVNFINENTTDKKHALAVFEFIAPFAPWQWYEKSGIEAVGAVPVNANEKDLNVFLGPMLIGKNRVYLFEYFADVTDPNRLVRKYLEVRQFRVTNFYSFNNLGFVYEMRRPGVL